MSIEEAEYILNEVVIEQDSIESYTYISAEEINKAIYKILEEKTNYEKEINKLENIIKVQEEKIKELKIKVREEKNNIYKSKIESQKTRYINYIIKYIKKLANQRFCLKNEEI